MPCRALAAPISHDQRDEVQSVIDAIKAKAEIPTSIIDHVEAALKGNGALDAENIAVLNQKIEVS